jgi:hypothetical protein
VILNLGRGGKGEESTWLGCFYYNSSSLFYLESQMYLTIPLKYNILFLMKSVKENKLLLMQMKIKFDACLHEKI